MRQCPRCGRASVADGTCPLDGAPLEEEPDGRDVAVHQALLHGGSVVQLGGGALGAAEGIAAVVRF